MSSIIFETYQYNEKLSPLVTEISWTNNLLIMSRCKTQEEREFYMQSAKHGLPSKRGLSLQIDAAYFERVMLGGAKLAPLVREIAPMATDILNYRED